MIVPRVYLEDPVARAKSGKQHGMHWQRGIIDHDPESASSKNKARMNRHDTLYW